MAVRKKIDKVTGKEAFEAYWNARSKKFPYIRVQRYEECETEAEAYKVERRLIKESTEEVARREALGTRWKAIIDAWETEAKNDDGVWRNPITGKCMAEQSVRDTCSALRKWTRDWLDIPAGELNRGKGKEVLRMAEAAELSKSSLKRIKNSISMVYEYGIQEGIIQGAKESPVFGLVLECAESEKLPEILTVEEVRTLLLKAREQNHTWYPIWAMALTTGMRSSELYALRKANVLLNEGLIRITESWDWLTDKAKGTKAKYWRNAPIPSALLPVIKALIEANPESEFLLPRPPEWEKGEQAMVLRRFCEQNGLPSIRFHSLRACFATHLLASGVEDAVVMRIGGWKDFKTFQIYVRLAGVREKGASDKLGQFILPNDQKVMERISSLYGTNDAA